MKSNKKTLLQLATAAFGASVIAVTIFIGGVDEKGVPDPITVDNQTIEFTWTDENSNEDLLIWTDEQNYNNGLSNATVYAAVQNKTGVDQEVELMGYFVNDRRRIEEVFVLAEVTKQGEELFKSKCKTIKPDKKASSTEPYEECENIPAGYGPDVVTKEWLPLETTPRDVYEEAKENKNLQKKIFSRKSVDGYIATKKTLQYLVPEGGVTYYKIKIDYPANDDGNFFLEAIGSEGGYGHLDPWFDASWNYRVAITVDDAQVPSTQTSFPVYVDLSDMPAAFFTNAKSDGCDIRVVESDETTETAFELVSYDAGGTGELHFMADSLTGSGGGDTTFYIYYGNSGASCYATSDTYGAENVWGDYELVLHMNEASGNAIDSSSNGYDFTDNNTVGSGAGQLGDGRDFEFSNSEYFSLADNANISLSDSNVTIQSWFKLESVSNVLYYISQKGWYISATGNLEFNQSIYTGATPDYFRTEMYDGSFRGSNATGVTINASSWYFSASRHNVSTNQLISRVNTTNASAGTMNTSQNGATGMYIGVGHGGTEGSKEYYMDGIIDEYRYRKSYLSDDWLTAEYNNQSSPSTFYTVGSEESNTPAATRRIFMIE